MSAKKKSGAATSTVAAKVAIKIARPKERTFKTKWFDSHSEGISDEELCEAIEELKRGQGDDLGGGVWKKRLNKNLHRSIILAKARGRWIYAFLFAKKDQENINRAELIQFRKLAKYYGDASQAQLDALLISKELVEICHGCESESEDAVA